METGTYIIIFLIVILSLVLVWFVAMLLLFKNRLEVREIVGGRKKIKIYKARTIRDNYGNIWWKTARKTLCGERLIPVPPPEVLEITDKGKSFAACYMFPTGDIVWSKDDCNIDLDPPDDLFDEIDTTFENITFEELKDHKELPEELKDKETLVEKDDLELFDKWLNIQHEKSRREVFEHWKKQNKVVAPLSPVTTAQRQIIINNIKKAEERKTKSLREQLPTIVSISALVVIVLALFIFWGDIAKPVLEARQIESNTIKTQKEILTIIQDINSNVQRIETQQVNINQQLEQQKK